jgi:hypothetical protein
MSTETDVIFQLIEFYTENIFEKVGEEDYEFTNEINSDDDDDQSEDDDTDGSDDDENNGVEKNQKKQQCATTPKKSIRILWSLMWLISRTNWLHGQTQ